MKITSPFFVAGTIGLVITSIMHLRMASDPGLAGIHDPYIGLYAFFMALLFMDSMKLKPIKIRVRR